MRLRITPLSLALAYPVQATSPLSTLRKVRPRIIATGSMVAK